MIPNNHVKYFEYPFAKIESTDPEDEGLYQCIARNDYGNAVNSFYLHVNMTSMVENVPRDTKCFPMNRNSVFVTFKPEVSENMIQYLMASDSSPRQFEAMFHSAKKSFTIEPTGQSAKFLKPLKKFYLYMRNMVPGAGGGLKQKVELSRLSKPVVCATQGFEPKFYKSPEGIFFNWNTDFADENEPITSFFIQLQIRRNGITDSVKFERGIIGTYEKMTKDNYWSEGDSNWDRIPIINSKEEELEDGTKVTEIQVPGNVTGIFVVNARELSVRILGTTQPDGRLFEQDLRYLYWYNITAADISIEPISIGDIESRNVRVSWKGLKNFDCKRVCVETRGIIRDIPKDNRCELM